MTNPLRDVMPPGGLQTAHTIFVGLRHDEERFAEYYARHGREGRNALAKLEDYFLGQIEDGRMEAVALPLALSSPRNPALLKAFTAAERRHISEHVMYSLRKAARDERIEERRQLRRRRQLLGK